MSAAPSPHEEDTAPERAGPGAVPSLARNSFYKLIANAARQVTGLATGVMTARWLGPYDKGTLSTLLFAGHVMCFYVASLGLGDATAVLAGRGQSLQRLVSASIPTLFVASCAGVLGLVAFAAQADWTAIEKAVALGAVGLVLWVYVSYLSAVLNTQERFRAATSVTIVMTVTTTAFTVVFVGVLDKNVTGATAAAAAGFGSGLVVAGVLVHRSGIRFRPVVDLEILRPALRLGVGIQSSFLLIAVSQRIDQLAVFSLASPSEAGRYSVALTVGQLAAFVPGAVASAAFPRLARLDDAEAAAALERITRSGLASAVACAIPLAISMPLLVPFVWGDQYRDAAGPAIVLTVGAVAWSAQWLLARGAAARGRPVVLIVSFSVNCAVMIGLDLLLIGPHGLAGAAVASVVGAMAGLAVCLVDHRRHGHRVARLVPTTSDLVEIARTARAMVSPSSA